MVLYTGSLSNRAQKESAAFGYSIQNGSPFLKIPCDMDMSEVQIVHALMDYQCEKKK